MADSRTSAEYCEILEVGADASIEQIRRAHRRMVQIWHPDRFDASSELHSEAEGKLKLINEAYAFLCDHPPAGNPARAAGTPIGGASTSGQGGVSTPAESPNAAGGYRASGRGGKARETPIPSPFTSTNLAVVSALAVLAAILWPRPGTSEKTAMPVSSSQPSPVQPPPSKSEPPESRRTVQTPQRLMVSRPALVIYAPAQSEIDLSKGDEFEAIDSFIRYAAHVRQQLQEKRPDIEVITTDAAAIQMGDSVFVRKSTRDFGFALFSPAQRPKFLEGAPRSIDLFQIADDYFEPPVPTGQTELKPKVQPQ